MLAVLSPPTIDYTAFKTGALKTGDVATCEKLMNLNSLRHRKTYSKFPDRVYCLQFNLVLGQNETTLIHSDKRKRFLSSWIIIVVQKSVVDISK